MECEEIKEMILELQDCEDLNSWEYDFINDLANKDSYWLSDNQEEKLKQIYEKYA